jgi:hypothetical protein
MSNNGWTPLGKKVDLGREVQGTLAPTAGAVLSGYSLGTTSDGQPVLQGTDKNSGLAFYRLQAGTGVTIAQASDGNALVITSSVLAGNTPGVMLQSTYDPTASGIVAKAASVPWSGITGLPLTFPPTVPISESNVTNLVSDLAAKVPNTRMVNTSFSIEGGGPLSGDLTVSLIGDKASPGPDMRYGTDPNGVLGWYPASVGAGDMTQAVYDPDHDGIVEQSDSVVAGGVTTAAIASQAVTSDKLALGVAAVNLGYEPVNKTGDTMSGQLAVLMSGPNVNANMYQNAHLFAEVSPTGAGYPTIGLARLAPGGGSVAIWFNSGHADLNLEYGDGTAATLLSSISSIPGGQIAAGSITAGTLAAGVAQANLGYRPVNWNGDQMTNTSVFAWQREWGLGSTSWEGAPIRVQCTTSGARPQIAFWHAGLGYACSLYFETDASMRTIDAGGTVRVLMDSSNSPYVWGINSTVLTDANSPYAYGLNSPVCTQANSPNAYGLNYPPMNNNGGQAANGAVFNYFSGAIQLWKDVGINSTAWQRAALIISTNSTYAQNPSPRAGIGFQNRGYTAAYLYLGDDLKFHFCDNGGTDHVIQST